MQIIKLVIDVSTSSFFTSFPVAAHLQAFLCSTHVDKTGNILQDYAITYSAFV